MADEILYRRIDDTDGRITFEPINIPEPPPVIPPFPEFHDTFDELNPEDWTVVSGVVSAGGGDLTLKAANTSVDGTVRLERTWDREFELQIQRLKIKRTFRIDLPDGFYILTGGDFPFVKLLNGTDLLDEAAAGFNSNEEQLVIVKYLEDEIRVYVRRDSTNKWLHNDNVWRSEKGPAVIYERSVAPEYTGNILFSVSYYNNIHLVHQIDVVEPTSSEDDLFVPLAGPVPPLSAAGLTLPTFTSPWSHTGLAFRADGAGFPVDDPSLLDLVTISPFGPPPNLPSGRLAYMIEAFWTQDEWTAWTMYCQANSLDPNLGNIGDYEYSLSKDVGGRGSKELSYQPLRDWIKGRAANLMANSNYDGIFFDVAAGVYYKPSKYTTVQWEDLQGTLYREVWQAAPAGKYVMINGGNAKTSQNSRIFQWIPILYLDRQGGPADWSWHEWTAISNPKYRQSLMGDGWISVLDSLGGDAYCLNEDVKYGWHCQYLQRLTNIGGYQYRHFLGGGFNGDYEASGASGRHKWLARHYTPACVFDVGDPVSQVAAIDSGVKTFSGNNWDWRFYSAKFQNATVYYFPNYRIQGGYDNPSLSVAPPYTLTFTTPHDVLQFDGTWLSGQNIVDIPAGSGRIVRPSIPQ